MLLFIVLVQIGSLVPIYAVNPPRCPSAGEWILRAQAVCPHKENYTIENYACMSYIDPVEPYVMKYYETCEGPQQESPGEKTIRNNRNFENVVCSEDRYQPEFYFTTEGSDCVFQKSKCNEEGQVIYSNGSGTEDRTCRCNYVEGYAFLSQDLRHTCFCTPSVEDCTCYQKTCSSGLKLSPDYKCVPKDEANGNYICKQIRSLEKDKEVNLTKSMLEIEEIEGRDNVAAGICTGVVLFVFAIGLLIVMFWKRKQIYDRYIWLRTKDMFTSPLFNIDAIEDDDVQFSCEVCIKDLPMKWFKGDTEIVADSDQRYTIVAVGRIHQLAITGTKCGDSDNYSVQFKDFTDRKCTAKLNVQTLFNVPLKETVCVENDDIVFSCELCTERPIEWYKYDRKISPEDNRFIMSSESRVHTLTVKGVKIDDRGFYSVRFRQNINKAELIVLENISKEENNLFKLYTLLFEIAMPAVRGIFDKEIPADSLRYTLIRNKQKLENLKKRHVLRFQEYDLLFPKTTLFSGNIVFTELKYTENLRDVKQKEFKDLAQSMGIDLSMLFSGLPGKQEVEILEFKPCAYVALYLTTEDEIPLYTMVSIKDTASFTGFDIAYTRSSDSYRVDVILEYSDAMKEENQQQVAEEEVAQLFHSYNVRVQRLDFQPNYLLAKMCLKTKDYHLKAKLSEVLQNAMRENRLHHKTTPLMFPMKLDKSIEHKPLSENFDIRLMIVLLKNLVYDNRRSSKLPEEADLLRIQDFRNRVVHSTMHRMDEEFEEMWSDIEEILNNTNLLDG